MPCPMWYVLTIAVAPYQDDTIKRFLRERDGGKRRALTMLWFDSKMEELRIMNVTSALLVASFCAAFSWYDNSVSPWSGLACWTCGLVIAIGSLATAAQQTLSLNYLKGSPKVEDEIRDFIGHGTVNSAGLTEWQPVYSSIYILQMPVMMLKLSILLFLVGFGLTVWDASIKKGPSSTDTKVAIAYTVGLVFVAVNYFTSSVTLYRRASKVKVV